MQNYCVNYVINIYSDCSYGDLLQLLQRIVLSYGTRSNEYHQDQASGRGSYLKIEL